MEIHKNARYKSYLSNKEQRTMFPVVSRSSGHFGFVRLFFLCTGSGAELKTSPVKSGKMKLNLSRPITLYPIPRKKICIQEVAQFAPQATGLKTLTFKKLIIEGERHFSIREYRRITRKTADAKK